MNRYQDATTYFYGFPPAAQRFLQEAIRPINSRLRLLNRSYQNDLESPPFFKPIRLYLSCLNLCPRVRVSSYSSVIVDRKKYYFMLGEELHFLPMAERQRKRILSLDDPRVLGNRWTISPDGIMLVFYESMIYRINLLPEKAEEDSRPVIQPWICLWEFSAYHLSRNQLITLDETGITYHNIFDRSTQQQILVGVKELVIDPKTDRPYLLYQDSFIRLSDGVVLATGISMDRKRSTITWSGHLVVEVNCSTRRGLPNTTKPTIYG